MNDRPISADRFLTGAIPGFHQYILTPAPRLVYVSDHLCRMLGCTAEALLCAGGDGYAALVHPADRETYAAFLARGADGTLEYCLQRADGSLCHVSDTLTVESLADGRLLASSVLTELTELKQACEQLKFLSDALPCGFLRYTCDKQPRLTYINERMLKLLGFDGSAGALEQLALCRENLYLMIPMEERGSFARYLEQAYDSGTPLTGELAVQRFDGSRIWLFGWVTKSVNEQGEEEFQSACMDVTERYLMKKEQQTARYLAALTEVYDLIFSFDRGDRTVKCVHSSDASRFKLIENLSLQMEDTTDRWILDTVQECDRARVRAFFDEFFRTGFRDREGEPPQLRYYAKSSDGAMRAYRGLFLHMEEEVSLYCCRRLPEKEDADSLRSENVSLKNLNDNMQELVLRFTDGLAAFELRDDMVTPLYASDNVCEFFGSKREEWLPLMQRSTPLRQFVARSGTAYEEFVALLENGEAEFSYRDLQQGRQRRVKAICSQRSEEGVRYVMLYQMPDQPAPDRLRVRIRTFGYFDVFVDDKPIAFRNEKSKELFALLVDRRGGFVNSEEAIGFLWENEPVNPVTLSRYRKVALRLKNLLEEYRIPDIVETVSGKRRIVVDRVQCDLYDHLADPEKQLFKGSYLSNYSWGESTLAELTGENLW